MYTDISDINLNKETRIAKLSYNNNTSANVSGVYMQKYTIQSQNMPAFIPKIVSSSEADSISISNYNAQPPFRYINAFVTNMSIMLLNTATKRYSCCNVEWLPQRYEVNKPYSYTPSRQEILNNNYFYAYNSIHLISLIQRTLSTLELSIDEEANSVIMIKNGKTYQMLVKNTDIKVFFNTELQMLFNFYYKTSFLTSLGISQHNYAEIIIDNRVKTDVLDFPYCVSETFALSTRMFPFNTIEFITTQMSIEQISVLNNLSNVHNNTSAILFSHTVLVDDVDAVGGCLEFAASSNFRMTNINTQVTNYDIYVYFKTYDCFSVQLLLSKDDYINVLLEFVTFS